MKGSPPVRFILLIPTAGMSRTIRTMFSVAILSAFIFGPLKL